ncbi:hypothetical protein N8Z24_00330 [bacterium]|nr:hypothetical protein [bacterium]
MDIKKVLENINKDLPEEDSSLDFDSFFIGDGSAQIMKGIEKKVSRSDQLIGINSVAELIEKSKGPKFQNSLDDLEEFSGNYASLNNDEVYNTLLDEKREIFDFYGYLSIKSAAFKGRPILEKDLIVTKDDKYLLSYMLENEIRDLSVVKAISSLLAYKELGILRVIFKQVDGCPLCKAFDGSVFGVEELINKFSAGDAVIHASCPCTFIPIFVNRYIFAERINIDIDSIYVGEVLVKNMPKEFEAYLGEYLTQLDCSEVIFEDFTKIESWNVEVVRKEGKTLRVHNDYIRGRSPLDYLEWWLESSDPEDVIIPEDTSNLDIYYLNGHKVIEKDGNFIDINTGKVICVV